MCIQNQFYCRLLIIIITFGYVCIEAKSKDSLKLAEDLLEKEKLRIQSNGIKCSKQILNISELDKLRVSNSVEGVSCHVQYLATHTEDGWAWSSLGTVYSAVHNHNLAAACFKYAAKLGGIVTKIVSQWHYIGPFAIGKSETDGDPTEAFGGIRNISRFRFRPNFHLFSELAPSGKVFWSVLKHASSKGYIEISPAIPWSELVNSLGSTGILEWQGWAVGEIAVNAAEASILVRCMGVTNLYIDWYPIVGDLYHRGQYSFAVSLPAGVHTVFVKTRAKGNLAFHCDFDISSLAFELKAPHFLPDLHDGHFFSGCLSFPVANLHASRWLRNIKITLEDAPESLTLKSLSRKSNFAIAPGQIRLVSFELIADNFYINPCADLPLTVKVSTSEGSKSLQIALRCRKRHESFLFTFVDHDGSVQQAAVIRPVGVCDQPLCPVVLSLHGTTVPPQNQADSYKHMVDNKFVFGFEHAWLLAPTRHGAHNWEGPGLLTALTAHKQLSQITNRLVWTTEHRSTPNFAVIAGHSMGGHGAWHLASHYPDMALAVVSLSGWIRKEDYGDSNLFFRHDISTSRVNSDTKNVLEKCVVDNYVDKFITNLKGVSVFIRTGANDRTVHPYFARRMFRLMTEAGINVTYREVPGKDHWWWDTRDTNDGGCVNDQEIRSFTNAHLKTKVSEFEEHCSDLDKNCAQTPSTARISYNTPDSNENFTYTVSSVGFGGTVRGLKIVRQLIPHEQSSVVVEITEFKAVLKTRNVEILLVNANAFNTKSISWKQKLIEIDDVPVQFDAHEDILCLCRDTDNQNAGSGTVAGRSMLRVMLLVLNDGAKLYLLPRHLTVHWTIGCESCYQMDSLTERGPLTVGPARRVAEQPFLIVVGTMGSQEITMAIEKLAVYIGNLFFLTSDTEAPIVKDVDLSDNIANEYNLIVIGSPDENLHTQRYLSRLPIEYEQSAISLKTCRYDNLHTGVLTLAPHSSSHVALVLFGNSLEGLVDVINLATPTIPPMTRSPFSNMVPDFIITGPNFRVHGPGGYLCTGFWGNLWDFRPELTSCSHC